MRDVLWRRTAQAATWCDKYCHGFKVNPYPTPPHPTPPVHPRHWTPPKLTPPLTHTARTTLHEGRHAHISPKIHIHENPEVTFHTILQDAATSFLRLAQQPRDTNSVHNQQNRQLSQIINSHHNCISTDVCMFSPYSGGGSAGPRSSTTAQGSCHTQDINHALLPPRGEVYHRPGEVGQYKIFTTPAAS